MRRFEFFGSYSSFTYEAETIAYMNALGIADDSTIFYSGTPQQITGNGFWVAVNNFVLSLKTIGWSKFNGLAIYPRIGGTASRHAINLVNPANLDSAFRDTFFGGWIHNELGSKSNGVNAYSDTHLPHNILDINSNSFSFYSNENISENRVAMGVQYNAETYNVLSINRSDFGTSGAMNSGSAVTFTDTDSLGMYTLNRNSSVVNIFKNGIKKVESTITPSSFLSPLTIYTGGFNSASNIQYSSKTQCFVAVTKGLSDTDTVSFRNAVQTLQIALNRAV